MAIQLEAKRVKTGQSLTDFQSQAISAINQLSGIKTNLINLKTQIINDDDFTANDADEVQTVITDLAIRVQTLLS